jgi:FkbM family methyltransferase
MDTTDDNYSFDFGSFENHLKPYIVDNLDLIKSLLKRGDTYVDVGANTGLLSKLLIESLGEDYLEKVFLFEPIPKFAEECRKKFKDIHNVSVEQLALSNVEESKKMYVSKINYGYSKIYKEGMDIHPHYEFTVDSTTFSNWANLKKLEKVDFIKIDAEGHDMQVIEGCFDFINNTNKKPYILFEYGWYIEEENTFIEKMKDAFNYTSEFHCNEDRMSGDVLLIP